MQKTNSHRLLCWQILLSLVFRKHVVGHIVVAMWWWWYHIVEGLKATILSPGTFLLRTLSIDKLHLLTHYIKKNFGLLLHLFIFYFSNISCQRACFASISFFIHYLKRILSVIAHICTYVFCPHTANTACPYSI